MRRVYRLAGGVASLILLLTQALAAAPPTAGSLQCGGFAQNDAVVGGGFPPNAHVAVGAQHFGQVVQNAVRFSTRALTGNCPTTIVLNSSLSAFIGYTTKPLFDPRLVYDLTAKRWLLSVAAQPESSTIQYHFIMVSIDSDPTHGFYKHQFNMASIVGAGVLWDFPMLGYDQKMLILTGNKLDATPKYIGSVVVFLRKKEMYKLQTVPPYLCSFQGPLYNVGTIAPPIVLNQGPYTALAAADLSASVIRVYKFHDTFQACPTFLGSSDIATFMLAPPLAEQPGSGACPAPNCLDTGDGRFHNPGIQSGAGTAQSPVRFWQIRMDQDSGFPTPLTYQVNADTLAVEESCEIFASASSFDFNPAIVANEAGTIFVTWSSTDPVASVNAQVRISGKLSGDACKVMQSGAPVSQSSNPLTGNLDANVGHQRWGDYSAVALDPLDHNTVYGVNETIDTSGTTWKSFIFNMHNP